MMGHTNIRTTQGYAKVTDDKISEDMDRLIDGEKKFYGTSIGFIPSVAYSRCCPLS